LLVLVSLPAGVREQAHGGERSPTRPRAREGGAKARNARSTATIRANVIKLAPRPEEAMKLEKFIKR
jgi:hypothetical protein